MPTFCSVCSSSQQALIDRRLLAGEGLGTLSADYGVPVRELRHHRDEHVLQRGTQRRPRRPAPLMPWHDALRLHEITSTTRRVMPRYAAAPRRR